MIALTALFLAKERRERLVINWGGGGIREDFTEEVIFVEECFMGRVGISKVGKRMKWEN